MRKRVLQCKVISPMFSYGNDSKKVELRTTELKALMRYIYRIANIETDSRKLYEAEARRFGDAEKYASPVRLQMGQLNGSVSLQKLLLHDKYPTNNKPNNPLPCFSIGGTLQIAIRTHPDSDIEYYKNLIVLSLILGGMGKRTRRGRGCIAVDDPDLNLNLLGERLLFWIAEQLNVLNSDISGRASLPYEVVNNEIRFRSNVDSSKLKRPVIERIRTGREIRDMTAFLTRVDEASHRIKKDAPSYGSFLATGFAGKDAPGRFASSVIVSVTRTSEHVLLPIYTYMKAVYKNKLLDEDYVERDRFISYIEGGKY